MAVLPFDLGVQCNNHCRFCVQAGLRLAEAAEFDTDEGTFEERTVEAQLLALPGAAEDTLVFQGGEPTRFDALPRWIALARSRFVAVSVQTNGRRVSVSGYAQSLKDAGLTHLEVSIQGHNSAVHDYHTRTPGSFRQSARGLLNTRGIGLVVAVGTVVTRSNFRHLEAVAELVARVGAAHWLVRPALPLGAARDDERRLVPNPAMVEPHLRAAITRAERAGVIVHETPSRPTFAFGDLGRHP